MAIIMNTEKMADFKLDGDFEKKEETCVIPAGPNLCRLASYVEYGKHAIKYGNDIKPAALVVKLCFEFPLAEYTGNYPLTISHGDMRDPGQFFGAITVSDKLAAGEMSLEFANKTNYMKTLKAMNAACGTTHQAISAFVGAAFMCQVTHRSSKDGARNFANMALTSLSAASATDPMTRVETKYDVPELIGKYCALYDWDMPTPEDYKALKPWDKKAVKAAGNYAGSPTYNMLQADPELDKVKDFSKFEDRHTQDTQLYSEGQAPSGPSDAPGAGMDMMPPDDVPF